MKYCSRALILFSILGLFSSYSFADNAQQQSGESEKVTLLPEPDCD